MAEQIPEDPTADTFLRAWIRPVEALSLLAPMGDQRTAREIYRRLVHGMLFAAGSVSAIKASGATDPRQVILPDWWVKLPIIANPVGDFWLTAGVTLQVRRADRMGEYRTYEFFGVRFEPNGLQRVADDAGIDVAISPAKKMALAIVSPDRRVQQFPGGGVVGTITQEEAAHATAAWEAREAERLGKAVRPDVGAIDPFIEGAHGLTAGEAVRYFAGPVAPPRAPRKRKRATATPVTHSEFMEWFTSLPETDQAKGYRWIWKEAQTHFSPRGVPKKWATERVKGRDLGRKPKR